MRIRSPLLGWLKYQSGRGTRRPGGRTPGPGSPSRPTSPEPSSLVMLVAMLDRVISGFQSGADIAGIRAARAHGIPTGGAMPRGYLTEDGPRPEFVALYGAVELATEEYKARTERNVVDSD